MGRVDILAVAATLAADIMAANRSQGIETFGKGKLLVPRTFCSISVPEQEGNNIRCRFAYGDGYNSLFCSTGKSVRSSTAAFGGGRPTRSTWASPE